MAKKYDLISIGDCTVDAFIRLHEANVSCNIDTHKCQLCMSFADKVEYEDLKVIPAVGNSANVAVGLARLGFSTAIITAVGNDYYGKQILETYDKEGVSKKFVKVNPGVPTNYHFVLNFKAERTILVKHQAYTYEDPKVIDDVDWIYLSSLGANTILFHEKLISYLDDHPNIKMGFNPGTFQMRLGKEKLAGIYRHTHVLFVNREEAARILGNAERDIKKLFIGLHALGPKIVVITDGPAGAYVCDGSNQYFSPVYPDPKPPFSRTGAGDAFSTGVMGALMSGLTLPEALTWGAIESMNVVQYIGAQTGLLTQAQLLEYIAKAPPSYRVKKI